MPSGGVAISVLNITTSPRTTSHYTINIVSTETTDTKEPGLSILTSSSPSQGNNVNCPSITTSIGKSNPAYLAYALMTIEMNVTNSGLYNDTDSNVLNVQITGIILGDLVVDNDQLDLDFAVTQEAGATVNRVLTFDVSGVKVFDVSKGIILLCFRVHL